LRRKPGRKFGQRHRLVTRVAAGKHAAGSQHQAHDRHGQAP